MPTPQRVTRRRSRALEGEADLLAPRRRPDHARPARAGPGPRRRRAAPLDVPDLRRAGQPRLALRPGRGRSPPDLGGGRDHACSSASDDGAASTDVEVGVVGPQGLRRRLPRLAPARLRRAAAARASTPRPRDDVARARRRPEGDRPLPAPDRAAALRADAPRRWSASPSRSGRCSATTASPRPIAEHEPDMVLHGHAHAGTFEGAIGDVPGLQRQRPRAQRTSGSSSSAAWSARRRQCTEGLRQAGGRCARYGAIALTVRPAGARCGEHRTCRTSSAPGVRAHHRERRAGVVDVLQDRLRALDA